MNIVEYAEFLVKSIVLSADMVKITSMETEDTITLEIVVPEEEKGRVIGHGGKMIQALRVLIQAYAYQNKLKKVNINVDSF